MFWAAAVYMEIHLTELGEKKREWSWFRYHGLTVLTADLLE